MADADVSTSVGAAERMLEELVSAAEQVSPAEFPEVLKRYAGAMGLGRAVVHLIDLQQRLLLPLTGDETELPVDASLAGWAYRTASLRVEEDGSGGLVVWLPLANGAERIGTGRVVSTAVLEPAYELGGDAFDHSFTEDVPHVTILDAVGHDLASGLATSVAMAGSRNARRTGADLTSLVGVVESRNELSDDATILMIEWWPTGP
ncbi:hypothetical protein GCM10009574_067740 [Streptomyces asiaticus]|uniref:Uncharacterized protein n=2 Tax=Streptomyces rhizosphaericus TaxID=114699 RepID=A0ABP3ZUC5_9ACTN